MATIALANWKGGVGKTTSAANLAAAMGEQGRRVLLIDLDPQANLTEGFGLLEEPARAISDLLADPSTIVPEDVLEIGPGVGLIPSSVALGDLAWDLVREPDYQDRLAQVVEIVAEGYDVVLIDTPPGMGLWAGLALLAADAVVIPTRPHDSDVMATGKLCDYIETEIRVTNPRLQVLGALVTQGHSHWRLVKTTQRRLELDKVETLEAQIPAAVSVAAAPRTGKPMLWLEPDGKVACAYRRAAAEVLERLEAVPA